MFRLDSTASQLQLIRDKENRGTHHLVYRQNYRGIEVFQHEYRLTVNKNKEVMYMLGDFDPDVSVATTTPSVSANDALQRALESASVSPDRALELATRVVIFSNGGNYFLAYVVSFLSLYPPGDWEILVDAQNGSILHRINQVVDVNGTGNAYTSHPGNSGPSQKTLYFLGTSGYLNGTYVRTDNEDGADAYSSNYQYFYDSGHPNFDEANVYHHVTRMQYDFFRAMDPSYNPIQRTAVVHYGTNENNAYATSGGYLLFGDGDGVNYLDFAKEESIIYHENSHVVIFEANDLGTDLMTQARAMHEGFSDYFAASHSIDPTDYLMGEWVVPGSGNVRSLENNATWNGSFSQDWNGNGVINAYDYALVWAGALWDCQQSPHNIPRAVMNWVAYDALYDLLPNSTFTEALAAILASDRNTYSGTHIDVIRDAFNARGIYDPNAFSVTMSGPYSLELYSCGEYSATVSRSGNFSYAWYKDGGYIGNGTSVVVCADHLPTIWIDVVVTDNTYGGSESAFIEPLVWCDGCPQSIGGFEEIAIENTGALPERYTISQNYPNPFNPETEISFGLPEPSLVRITILDMLGREIVTLVNREYSAGHQNVTWRGTDASGNKVGSGVYFYRIIATSQSGKQFTKVMKMALTK